MKQRLVDGKVYRSHITKILLSSLFSVTVSIFLLCIYSNASFASRLQQTRRFSTPSLATQTISFLTVAPSPTVTITTSSNNPSQVSQVQSENSIATLTIEVAGAFIATFRLHSFGR